jgi:hypothetical protein
MNFFLLVNASFNQISSEINDLYFIKIIFLNRFSSFFNAQIELIMILSFY